MGFLTVENVCADCLAVKCPERVMAFLTCTFCRILNPEMVFKKDPKIKDSEQETEEDYMTFLTCRYRR